MCDYSLMHVKNRKAEVGDKLISSKFNNSISRGFAAVGDADTAVCVLPGTEIAFDEDIRSDNFPMDAVTTHSSRTAIFRQLNKESMHMHHDALELPSGSTVMLTRLIPGQTATVLQLPAAPKTEVEAEEQKRLEVVG
jgi:hypothetical protein